MPQLITSKKNEVSVKLEMTFCNSGGRYKFNWGILCHEVNKMPGYQQNMTMISKSENINVAVLIMFSAYYCYVNHNRDCQPFI